VVGDSELEIIIEAEGMGLFLPRSPFLRCPLKNSSFRKGFNRHPLSFIELPAISSLLELERVKFKSPLPGPEDDIPLTS